jgi:hypothetical protein
MRFALLFVSALLTAEALTAAQAADGLTTAASIRRIRAALERPQTIDLDRIDQVPRFRVVIREPQRFRDLPPLDFSAGPVPPGGLYAYEQRQRIGPPMSQPLVSIDVMPIAQAIGRAAAGVRRARGEAAARDALQRAIAEYCAAQPRAGDQICAMSPATR